MKPRTVIPFSHLSSRRIVPVIGATCSRYLTAVTLESDISPPYYGIASGNSSGIRLTLILFGKLARDDNSGRIVTRQGGWKLANFFLFFLSPPESRLSRQKWLFPASQLSWNSVRRWMLPLTHGLDRESRERWQGYTHAHPPIPLVTSPTGALVSTWIALGIRNIRRTSYALITWEFQQSARRFEGAYTINFVVRV